MRNVCISCLHDADVADVVLSRLRHNRAATDKAAASGGEKIERKQDRETQAGVSDLITT